MMVQFLLLMVGLDKIYYTPMGNFMDQRDASRQGHFDGGEAAGGAEGDSG
ncbi:ATP synthase subunit b', chloroplastic [Linum perenne]